MYSNDRGSRFSLVDILVKLIFAILFILVLIWLFKKNVPNMAPFYSNVFRENIKYMQEAGESYFTDDKLPKEIGQTSTISLSDMFDKKLVIPFVDKDGNSCNQYNSYVSVTKTPDGYELKTYLVCNTESDYTIKILGCHNYCDKGVKCECTNASGNCNEKPTPTKTNCRYEKLTEYQFKKQTTSTTTSYSCPSGYQRTGKYCFKNTIASEEPASVIRTTTRTDITSPTPVFKEGTRQLLQTIKEKTADKNVKKYVSAIKTTTGGGTTTVKEPYTCTKYKTVTESYTCTKYKTVTESFDCPKTRTKQVPYDCSTSSTEKQCTTKYKTETYDCDCSSYLDGSGRMITTCNTCTRTIPYEECNNISVTVPKTCYKTVTETYTGTCYKDKQVPYNDTCYRNKQVPYNDTCYKDVTKTIPAKTTYSCPNYADGSEGSGANLKCYYYETIQGGYNYRCPSGTNYQTGSGSSLKCYKVTNGKYSYVCPYGYTLKSDNLCYKTLYGTITENKCRDGYKLEGDMCRKYTTTKIAASSKTISKGSYIYKWSKSSTLSGWTSTGKTRTVNGKKICD